MSLDDLTHVLPRTKEIPEIEGSYDTRKTTKQLIRCIHCGFPNHNAGFVMQFSDGARILVGNTCGMKLYGADFVATQRDFEAAQARAIYLKRRRAALAGAIRFQGELAALIADLAPTLFGETKMQLNRGMPKLADRVARACMNDSGALFVDVKVRNFEAEAHREEMDEIAEARTGKKPPRRKPIYKQERRQLWTVAGQGFWKVADPPLKNLQALSQCFDEKFSTLRAMTMTTTQLRNWFKSLSDLIDKLKIELSRLRDLPEAFELRNLEMISKWMMDEHGDRSRYSAAIGSISNVEPDSGKIITIKYPNRYIVPSTAWPDTFLAALGMSS